MVMASSTASAGSKRHAVEDEDLLQSDQTRESKRQKSAKKSSSNGKQNISHYFAPKNTKKGDRSALSGSDDHESKPLPRKVSAEEVSQRRDRSISPPIRSRRKKTLQTVDKGDAENKRPKEPERDADDNSEAQFLHISEHIGDLFDAPANSLLIHACNCKGWWGKGIAEAFKEKYPAAFKVYQAHCKKTSERQLVGKALLIPPQPNDRHQHYVGCVFTSAAPGRNLDPPHKILKATGSAMSDLLAQARSHISSGKGDISDIRTCKINSVLFKVKWEKTLEVLRTKVEPHGFTSMEVIKRSGDD